MIIFVHVKKVIYFIVLCLFIFTNVPDANSRIVIRDLLEQATQNINNKKEALKKTNEALKDAEKNGDINGQANAHYTLGLIYKKHNNILKANRAFDQALKLSKRANNVQVQMNCHLRLAELNDNVVKYGDAIKHYKAFSDLYQQQLKNKNRSLKQSLGQVSEKVETQTEVIQDLKEDSLQKEQQIDSMSAEFKLAQIQSELEVEQANLAVEKQKLITSTEKNKRNIFIAIASILALGIFFILFAFFQKQKSNKQLAAEKAKSDSLLLNILPSKVAEELKDSGTTTPRQYKLATVLFTDFKGFTSMAEKMPVKDLVNEIDLCFKAFDKIVSKYDIEKIKTIGDAYLCVCGLPNQNPNHVNNILNAAIELQEFMKQLGEQRKKEGKDYFEMRVGVHCGPLIAGVVGSTKFAYDIWGDTVNTAARMEQSCLPGKINVSQSVVDLSHEFFEFTYRGEIEAKNKGQMAMYFLEKQKALTA